MPLSFRLLSCLLLLFSPSHYVSLPNNIPRKVKWSDELGFPLEAVRIVPILDDLKVDADGWNLLNSTYIDHAVLPPVKAHNDKPLFLAEAEILSNNVSKALKILMPYNITSQSLRQLLLDVASMISGKSDITPESHKLIPSLRASLFSVLHSMKRKVVFAYIRDRAAEYYGHHKRVAEWIMRKIDEAFEEYVPEDTKSDRYLAQKMQDVFYDTVALGEYYDEDTRNENAGKIRNGIMQVSRRALVEFQQSVTEIQRSVYEITTNALKSIEDGFEHGVFAHSVMLKVVFLTDFSPEIAQRLVDKPLELVSQLNLANMKRPLSKFLSDIFNAKNVLDEIVPVVEHVSIKTVEYFDRGLTECKPLHSNTDVKSIMKRLRATCSQGRCYKQNPALSKLHEEIKAVTLAASLCYANVATQIILDSLMDSKPIQAHLNYLDLFDRDLASVDLVTLHMGRILLSQLDQFVFEPLQSFVFNHSMVKV